MGVVRKRSVRYGSCQISGCCCPTAALDVASGATKSSLLPAPTPTDRLQYPYKSTISCLPMHYAVMSSQRPTFLPCIGLISLDPATKSSLLLAPSPAPAADHLQYPIQIHNILHSAYPCIMQAYHVFAIPSLPCIGLFFANQEESTKFTKLKIIHQK